MRHSVHARWSLRCDPMLGVLVASLALAVAASGCIDKSQPSWFDGKQSAPDVLLIDGQSPDQQSGLTARLPGQTCIDCQDSTCADWQAPPTDSLRLHFIDVGQGDSIWIQTPDGQNVLIDAGDGGFFGRSIGGNFVNAYLDRNGFEVGSAFDAIFVTHAHSDHYGGIGRVLGSYRTQRYIDPGLEATTQSYQDILSDATAFIDPSNVFRPALLLSGPTPSANTLVGYKGDPIPADIFGPQVGAWLLSGEPNKRLGSSDGSKINNTSLVIKLSFAGRRVLFTGDAEQDLESELIQRFGSKTEEPSLTAEVLKVGHHGSKTASTNIFLSAVWSAADTPHRTAVIQSGRLSFSGTTLPNEQTVRQIQALIGANMLFSTESGDVNKSESESPGDDDLLTVIRKDGTMFTCYTQP
jgi:competence protein ComEC